VKNDNIKISCIKSLFLRAKQGLGSGILNMEIYLSDSLSLKYKAKQLDSFRIESDFFLRNIKGGSYPKTTYNDSTCILKIRQSLTCLGQFEQKELDSIAVIIKKDIKAVFIDKKNKKSIIYPCK
jgi:hypothetical protein